MDFLILSQIGAHYQGEEGTEGVRRGALTALENTLKALYTESDAAALFASGSHVASNLPALGRGRVKELTKFFEKEQTKYADVVRANEAVIRVRQWLFRQNAVLTPDGKIVWAKSQRRVVYDNELQRQNLTQVTFRGSSIFTADGKPLDTKDMVTHFSGPGYAIYVMSQQGHFHVGSHSVGYRHHSSFLAGGMVAGAGELRATNGQLKLLSNKSGHYQPDPYHLLQVIHGLWLNMGRAMPDFAVTCVDPTGTHPFPGVRPFLGAYGFDNTTVELTNILTGYGHVLTREFCAANHLAWGVGNGVLGAIYDTSVTPPRRLTHDELVAMMARAGHAPRRVYKKGAGR